MIKIDMDMPKSCETCKFYDRFGCYISGHCFIDADKDQPRMIDCPLIECENEKSCKLTLWDEDSNTYECSECKMKWTLIEGTPKDNEMKFCPECGCKINENI